MTTTMVSLKDVAPFATPALTLVVLTLSLLVVPALRLSRNLRKDLVDDAGIVDKLPKAEQRELRNDMGARASLLVAYSRYPSTTRVEGAVILLTIATTAAGVFNGVVAPDGPSGYFDGEVFAFQFLLASAQIGWVFVTMERWCDRTRRRLTFVDEHLDQAAADEVVRSTRLTYALVRGAILVLITTTWVPTWWMLASPLSSLGTGDLFFALICAGGLALLTVGLHLGLRDKALIKHLGRVGSIIDLLGPVASPSNPTRSE